MIFSIHILSILIHIIACTLLPLSLPISSPPLPHTHSLSPFILTRLQEDLDTLTASGSAINDLEMQLTRAKAQYRRTVNESREKMDTLRKKLGSHIKKSEPFVEIWRKARQVSASVNGSYTVLLLHVHVHFRNTCSSYDDNTCTV